MPSFNPQAMVVPLFGALSADGSLLVVGVEQATGGAVALDGEPDTSANPIGMVYVFGHASSGWEQQLSGVATNTANNSYFGSAVAISSDGTLITAGASGESSAATGIDGDQTNTSAESAGAAYVFN